MSDFLAAAIPALGHALLQFLWQGVLIGAVAGLALRGLRHARPQARYVLACLALLACVFVPIATLLATLAATSPAIAPALPSTMNAAADTAIASDAFALPAIARSPAASVWIVALWAAGAGVLFLRLAAGVVGIQRLRRTPQDALHAAWQIRLDALAVRIGLRRGVALRLVDTLDSPVAAGWWRPVVLVPSALLVRLSPELLEALLAHELAHVRRHDYLVNLLQHVVEALLFYHPVTWWLSQRIRGERELIADQLAAEATGRPRQLALALSELSDLQRGGVLLQLAQAAHGGDLLSRIRQLVRPRVDGHGHARIAFPLLALAAACVACHALASMPPVAPGTTAAAVASAAPDHAIAAPVRMSFARVDNAGGAPQGWGPDVDTAAIEAAQRGAGAEFLWVRRAGVDYRIVDASLVASARAAWQDADALKRRLDMSHAQMADLNDRAAAVHARLGALSAAVDTSASATGREAWTALVAEAGRLEETLRVLSRRIGGLAREHEAAAHRAARDVHRLVDDALARGLAVRMPARA